MKKSMNNFMFIIAITAFCIMGLSAFAQSSSDRGAYSGSVPAASFGTYGEQEPAMRMSMPQIVTDPEGDPDVSDTMFLWAATKIQHRIPSYQAEIAAQPGPLAGLSGSWYIFASLSLLFLIMVPMELRYRICYIDLAKGIHVYPRKKLRVKLAIVPSPVSYQVSAHNLDSRAA